jgi:rubrerythrin
MSFFGKNEIVEMAVRMEQYGFAFYDEALKRTDLDEAMKQLLSLLRDEEQKHEQIFLQLRKKIDVKDITESASWAEVKLYIDSLVESHVFSDPKKAIHLAKAAINKEELLKYAIQFETDTILFFFSIARFIRGTNSTEILDKIINEEASHIKKLRGID